MRPAPGGAGPGRRTCDAPSAPPTTPCSTPWPGPTPTFLAGSTPASRSNQAWRQLYRALDHAQVKRTCTNNPGKARLALFPQEIQDFADQFVTMQSQRHLADYDPLERFSRSDVLQLIHQSDTAISDFNRAANPDRRAFAVLVMFKLRT